MSPGFLAFVAVVWVCWGAYGVQVHSSIVAFGKSGIRSMVAISAAYGVVAFLMNYIRKHDFTIFGYYRIVLGVIVLAYFLL